MLQLPDLNDRTFEELLESAIKQINIYSDYWNDLDIHDPGITFIELLAYLTVIQQESINKVGERSLNKFADLLGIQRQQAIPAEVYVRLKTEKNIYLPKGSRFYAFDNCYETKERMFLMNNRICAIGVGTDTSIKISEYDEFSSQRKIEIFGEEHGERMNFYILLKNSISCDEIINFYIEFYQKERKRNKIIDEKNFIPLSTVQWQYYGIKDNIEGWYDVEICQDYTYQMLFSGIVSMKISGEQKKVIYENEISGYPLRAVIKEYGYEKPPIFKNIHMNVFTLRQVETLCESFDFTYKDFDENRMIFDSYIAFYNHYELFIKDGDGFIKAEDIGILFAVRQESNNLFRLGTSDRSKLYKHFYTVKEKEIVFRLVCYDDKFYNERYIGSGKGIANQIIQMKPELKGILYDSFNLMLCSKTQNGQLWNKWDKTLLFDNLKSNERKYVINSEEASLMFGNNINGKVPSRIENNILVTEMKLTKDVFGQVQKNTIKYIDNKYISEKIEAFQFVAAFGAKAADKTDDFLERAVNFRYSKPERAVTAGDYEYFAKNTQGLIVENATVIPLYRPYMENYPERMEENSVTVVVEPPWSKQKKRNLHNYLKNVENLLNRVKMITTKVYVMIPQYFALDVYADVVVSFDYNEEENQIEKIISNYLSKIQSNKLGCVLYHGDFFAEIEGMEQILKINYLKLELVGNKIKGNNFGDIKIPPYARAYLKSVYVTFNYN